MTRPGAARPSEEAGGVCDVGHRHGEQRAHVLPTVEHHGSGVIALERPLESVWQFLVAANAPKIAELGRGRGIRLIGAGNWILLPPTQVPGGAARWVVRPRLLGQTGDLAGPTPPHSPTLQWAVVRALVALAGSG
jgi:hypothetical protein